MKKFLTLVAFLAAFLGIQGASPAVAADGKGYVGNCTITAKTPSGMNDGGRALGDGNITCSGVNTMAIQTIVDQYLFGTWQVATAGPRSPSTGYSNTTYIDSYVYTDCGSGVPIRTRVVTNINGVQRTHASTSPYPNC